MPRSFCLRRAIKAHSVAWCNLGVVPAVDTVQTDTFSPVVVKDFDGVTVEDGNDGASEVGRDDPGANQGNKEGSRWKRALKRATVNAGELGGSVLVLPARSLPNTCPLAQRLLDRDRSSDPRWIARYGRMPSHPIDVRPRDCEAEAG